MCLGVLITALAATVCLGMIAYYQPVIEKIYPCWLRSPAARS